MPAVDTTQRRGTATARIKAFPAVESGRTLPTIRHVDFPAHEELPAEVAAFSGHLKWLEGALPLGF